MSGSESSDQPIRPAELPPVLIWTERYLVRSRFDLGGRE